MSGASTELDPFERFNRSQGQGRVRSPYPRLAEWRRAAPVRKLELDDLHPGMRLQSQVLFGTRPPRIFVVLSHDAVAEVLRDGERFSSGGYARTIGLVLGHSILEMDEPEHARARAVIQQAFGKRALDHWEHDLVSPIVHGLIDRFAGRGSADLVRELTFPFPVSVIAHMLGVAEQEHATFHRLAVELISLAIDPALGIAASQALREMFARVIAERRRVPTQDLISVLAHAELDGVRLDDEAIFAFARLLTPAGAETTYRSSSNLLFGLLSHPAQLDAVRRDRALVPQAIEEGLRWESPLTSIQRTCTRDTEVGGVAIPAGAIVLVSMAAANRDESRYERPDEFDIFRPAKTHMAFAFGPHRCLGMHLARMETRVVLEALLDRLPNLRLDPEAKDPHITGEMFRSPLELPVLFEALAEFAGGSCAKPPSPQDRKRRRRAQRGAAERSRSQARSTYFRSRVSMRSFSPRPTKLGTWTIAPVASFAGFSLPPLVAGSVSTTSSIDEVRQRHAEIGRASWSSTSTSQFSAIRSWFSTARAAISSCSKLCWSMKHHALAVVVQVLHLALLDLGLGQHVTGS